MKLRKYKKMKYLERSLIIIILSIILSFILINYYSKKANIYLTAIGEMKAKKAITRIINNSINDIKFDNDLFQIIRNTENKIEMISYNSYEMTSFINEITYIIEEDLNNIETNASRFPEFKNGIIGSVPVLRIFNNSFLGQVGPKVNIKFDFIGNVLTRLETEVKPYGINNSYVEVRINVTVNGQIVMPFVSKEITIDNVIPLSMNIVPGSVPNGFITSFN